MPYLKTTLAAAVLLLAGATVLAADSTKDIVLDRVRAPTIAIAPLAAAGDAMAISVLLESVDGTLRPKGTDTLFHTGDRFRVKLLASRDGKVALYNTNPQGVLNATPVWQGDVTVGQETISPRMALTGTSGVDQLHVVMQPHKEAGVLTWLGNWLSSSKGDAASKDIQLDVQNTPTSTYLLNPNGQGLVSTIRIAHTR